MGAVGFIDATTCQEKEPHARGTRPVAVRFRGVARAKKSYHCTACGVEHPCWSGRCVSCGAWNTVQAQDGDTNPGSPSLHQHAMRLSDIEPTEVHRFKTGTGELDRVLGGGLVAGSVVLVGGEPGIGKSTLLMQVAMHAAEERRVL